MTSPWEEGTPDRPMCILAEAPAKVEMSWSRPLVGPSGEVFNDCLRSAGIPRQYCYILNLWPCQVYKDNLDVIKKDGRVLYHPKSGFTDEGLELAEPSVERLKQFQGNIIVSLGRPALHMLSGDRRPVMKWRGSPLWSDKFQRKYIPTVHPAATIHGVYVWRFFIENDLGKARLEMDDPKLELPQRELLVGPTLADVYHFMNQCRQVGRFATDLEVINHQVSCFSLAVTPQLAMTIPFLDKVGDPYWSEADELLIWKWYADLMGDEGITKVNQNIVGFDIPFLLSRNHIHTRGPIGDTMIAQHIMYPHFPKGLDFIASWHTREPYWKDEGKIWKPNHKIDWHTFQRYCGKDSAVALEAWDILSEELAEGDYWPTYNMTIEMKDPLSYMSIRGLAVDRQRLDDTKVRLEQVMADKQKALDELTGNFGSLNPNSPKACKEYFYDYLKIHPYVNREGGVTTDDKAMSRIFRKASKGSREAKLVQEIRAARKLKGTYVDVRLDNDSRLRCSWNPRGTWTGRLSSSKTIFDTGMNLQNLHPEFKGFIVGG